MDDRYVFVRYRTGFGWIVEDDGAVREMTREELEADPIHEEMLACLERSMKPV